MLPRLEQFIRERQYVMNVSPATVRWYSHALRWLDSETPTQAELNALVVRMRERGLKATGCNAATRAINAYLHWTLHSMDKSLKTLVERQSPTTRRNRPRRS